MTYLLPSSRVGIPLALAGVLGLLQFACASGPVSPPTPTVGSLTAAEASPQPAPPPLALGKATERELDGARPDEVSLHLEADQYARLILDQKQMNVTARLLDASGETIATAEGPGGWQAPVLLSLVTAARGEYRLVVASNDHGTAKDRYTVKLDELRPARPEDGDRVKAEAALSEAIRLRIRNQEGDLAAALTKGQEALSLWKQIGDVAGEIKALLELTEINFQAGDEPQIRELLQQALSESVATHDRLGEAKALRMFATFVDLGAETRIYFDRALEIARQLGEVGEQAVILFERGSFEFNQAKFSEAMAFFQQALDLAQAVDARSLAARSWNGIGGVHTSRGEREEALSCYKHALNLARQVGNRGTEAAALTGIGILLRRRGELQAALTNLLTALDLNQSLGDRRDQGQVLLQLGVIYLTLGDTDQALRHNDQARELFHVIQDRGREGVALIQLGTVYSALKEWQAALENFEQAWIISSSPETKNARRMGAAMHGIGVARLNLGQTAEAIQSLERALPLRRDAGDRLGEAATLLELGEVYQGQGDWERAVSLTAEALQIGKQAEALFVQAQAQFRLSKLERDRRDPQQALIYIERSIQILESARSNLGDRLRSSFFASRRSYYDVYVDLLMRMGNQEKALEASERARARSLLDLLSEGRIDLTQGISPELKRQEADLAARLSETQGDLIDELSKQPAKEEAIANLRARLDEILGEREKLEVRIRSEHPRYAEVRYPFPLRLEEIQKQLSEDEALLEYSLGEEGAYLFVVSREHLEAHRLADASRITEEVQAVRNGLEEAGRRSFSSYVRSAQWLYRELIAPARPLLAQKRHLLISPDGPLHFLAFEALLTENDKGREAADLPYLLRDFSVSYIPSASVLSWLAKPQPSSVARAVPSKRFLAFADPFYGPAGNEPVAAVRGAETEPGGLQESGLGPVPRLIGTAREVAAIAGLYPSAEVQLYEEAQANEENVKDNPLVEKAQRIHFATHGVLNERQPELSGLRLTRTDKEDGILQVHEIFNLNLSADLVVLSACDTGRGKEVTGEGLVGLTRAFLYAGTPSVVVSLWQVADTQASGLMLRFYQGLDQLGNKAEALRQAKLAMIRDRSYARPYYWAPFILVGRP